MNLTHLILAGAGGFIGSIARYATVVSVDRKLNSVLPYGTLLVNVAGSFALGFILGWLARKTGDSSDQWRIFLGTGFCGGFTTFSAFAVENVTLFQQRLPGAALLYILASLIAGLAAVWLGFTLSRTIY
ncbi:MAG: fluoride efflux transporter CrcB [Bacteroidota bacterium]|nr:fluoride efflux transporter CrcB [Bacteroidota bacterium]